MPCIYVIRHKDSGRSYVGQTGTSLKARFSSHRYYLRRGTHHSPYLQNVWTKYGETAFECVVLEECAAEDLTACEQKWIDRLKPVFNVAPAAGSSLGVKRSDETKLRLSIAMLGNSNGAGKKSDETRAKISAIMTGKARP